MSNIVSAAENGESIIVASAMKSTSTPVWRRGVTRQQKCLSNARLATTLMTCRRQSSNVLLVNVATPQRAMRPTPPGKAYRRRLLAGGDMIITMPWQQMTSARPVTWIAGIEIILSEQTLFGGFSSTRAYSKLARRHVILTILYYDAVTERHIKPRRIASQLISGSHN